MSSDTSEPSSKPDAKIQHLTNEISRLARVLNAKKKGYHWPAIRNGMRAAKRTAVPKLVQTTGIVPKLVQCFVPWSAFEYPGRTRWLIWALGISRENAYQLMKKAHAANVPVPGHHLRRIIALAEEQITKLEELRREAGEALVAAENVVPGYRVAANRSMASRGRVQAKLIAGLEHGVGSVPARKEKGAEEPPKPGLRDGKG